MKVSADRRALTEVFASQHVIDSSGRPHHDVRGLGLQLGHLGADVGPSDAGVAAGAHVVPQSQNHLLDLQQEQTKLS